MMFLVGPRRLIPGAKRSGAAAASAAAAAAFAGKFARDAEESVALASTIAASAQPDATAGPMDLVDQAASGSSAASTSSSDASDSSLAASSSSSTDDRWVREAEESWVRGEDGRLVRNTEEGGRLKRRRLGKGGEESLSKI